MRPLDVALLFSLLTLSLPFEAEGAADQGKIQRSLASVRTQAATPERWAEEARLLFELGSEADGESAKRPYFTEGLALSEKARAASADLPAALLQWSLHASAIAALDQNLSALRRIKDIEATLLRLKEKAPAYEHAAADRTLGLLYRNAPQIISVGSPVRAGRHLRAAFAAAPDYPGNCLFLADYLLGEGDGREARSLAKRCGSTAELARFPEHAEEWGRVARRVLDKTSFN